MYINPVIALKWHSIRQPTLISYRYTDTRLNQDGSIEQQQITSHPAPQKEYVLTLHDNRILARTLLSVETAPSKADCDPTLKYGHFTPDLRRRYLTQPTLHLLGTHSRHIARDPNGFFYLQTANSLPATVCPPTPGARATLH